MSSRRPSSGQTRGVPLVRGTVVAMMVCVVSVLQAAILPQRPSLSSARCVINGSGVTVDADFQVQLPSFYLKALDHGIPLYITIYFRLNSVDWYFFSKEAIQKNVEWKLSYHQLTEKYRLSHDQVYRVFDALDDVLRVVCRVHSWAIPSQLSTKKHYRAQIRWSIDVSRLPIVFQVGHFATDDDVDSGWFSWSVKQGDGVFVPRNAT